jgi:hypothetical protein
MNTPHQRHVYGAFKLNRQRILLPIPFALAEMQAGLLELLPNPPLTRDQVRLLKNDK